MMNIISMLAAITQATKANENKPVVTKTANERRHEREDAVYNAIANINGASNVTTWTTNVGVVCFSFMWHDTYLEGTETDGKVIVKTRKGELGNFYRSMGCGMPIITNTLKKKWSNYVLTSLCHNIMDCSHDVTSIPYSITLDGTQIKVEENKLIVKGEKPFTDTSIFVFDVMGHLCWNDDPKYAWLVDFIKRNFVK